MECARIVLEFGVTPYYSYLHDSTELQECRAYHDFYEKTGVLWTDNDMYGYWETFEGWELATRGVVTSRCSK